MPDSVVAPRPDWQQIAAMSQAILAAAQANDWDAVSALEPQRRTLMEAFFAYPVGVADADAVAQGIREVLDVDREVMVLCQQTKDALSQQMGQLTQGRRAEAAYTSNR